VKKVIYICYIFIYLLTTIGFSPGGSTHLHKNNTQNNTNNNRTRQITTNVKKVRYICYICIYLLTTIGLTPGGRITVHIYTQTVHRTTQLTLRRLMSYIYGAPILDVSRSHTTTQHSR